MGYWMQEQMWPFCVQTIDLLWIWSHCIMLVQMESKLWRLYDFIGFEPIGLPVLGGSWKWSLEGSNVARYRAWLLQVPTSTNWMTGPRLVWPKSLKRGLLQRGVKMVTINCLLQTSEIMTSALLLSLFQVCHPGPPEVVLHFNTSTHGYPVACYSVAKVCIFFPMWWCPGILNCDSVCRFPWNTEVGGKIKWSMTMNLVGFTFDTLWFLRGYHSLTAERLWEAAILCCSE